MISIYDAASVYAVHDQPLSDELKDIIRARWSDAETLGLGDETHIAVIQPQDNEQTILSELGWSPLVHPINETRFGKGDFQPYWSWLQDLGGWYELLHTVGNSGFAYILLIEKGSSQFADMCEQTLKSDSQPCAF